MLATGTQSTPIRKDSEGWVLATGTQSTPIRKDSEGVCLLRVPSLLL